MPRICVLSKTGMNECTRRVSGIGTSSRTRRRCIATMVATAGNQSVYGYRVDKGIPGARPFLARSLDAPTGLSCLLRFGGCRQF